MRAADLNLRLLHIVLDAAVPVQMIMLALILATGAAIVFTARKLTRPIDGGSAVLRTLRWAGPLVGAIGGAYTALFTWLAVGGLQSAAWMAMAPALAEATFTLILGIVAGLSGAVGTGLIKARIDRAVLAER